jgi:hypothetical protein
MSTFSTWDHNNCNLHKPKTNRNNDHVQKKIIGQFQIFKFKITLTSLYKIAHFSMSISEQVQITS